MPGALKSLYQYSRAVVRFVLIITNNFYCIPTHVLWLWLLTPLRRYSPALYYRIEGYLFSWLLAMVALWSWSAGYDIVEQGDDITRCLNRRTLVISNHQSTADVPMLMAALNARPGVLRDIMWIMDRMFKFTNFGVVSSYHRDFFIASGKDRRDESVRRLRDHLVESYIPLNRKWMVLFPEGGFLTKRKPISMRFAAKNNLPVLHNVTLPRMGAFFVVRDTLLNPIGEKASAQPLLNGQTDKSGDSVHNLNNNFNNNNYSSGKEKSSHRDSGEDSAELEYVLDITVAYPDGKPLNLKNIITGLREPCQTVLYYRLYSTRELPRDDAGLTQWTYERFYEKEAMLECYYKNKTFFPVAKANEDEFESKQGEKGAKEVQRLESPCVLSQDPLRFVILHLFFLTSTYLHYQMISAVLQNCVSLYSWMVL